MWKAFDEMEKLGWIGQKRPRMFSVQAEGCAPIVRAFEAGENSAAEFPNAHTLAAGLRVPKAIGDFLILNILRQSNGGAIAVNDAEMIRVAAEVASSEGLFVAPEGAACFAALKSLLSSGKISPDQSVVIFNTGSGIRAKLGLLRFLTSKGIVGARAQRQRRDVHLSPGQRPRISCDAEPQR